MRNVRTRIRLLAAAGAGLIPFFAPLQAAEPKAPPSAGAPTTEVREVRRVIVLSDDDASKSEPAGGKQVVVIRKSGADAGDGKRTIIVRRAGSGGDNLMIMNGPDGVETIGDVDCKDVDGKPTKPLVDLSDEEGDPGNRRVMKTLICTSADAAADPARQIDALKKALARFEDEARREAAHREKVMAAIRDRIAALEAAPKK